MARKLREHELATIHAYVDRVLAGELNIMEASKLSGFSYATLYRHCRASGAETDGREGSSLTANEQSDVRRLRAHGWGVLRISKALGRGRTSVRNAIKKIDSERAKIGTFGAHVRRTPHK